MIRIETDGKFLVVTFDKVGSAFGELVKQCKRFNGRWDGKKKRWLFSPLKYHEISDALSDYGVITDCVDKASLEKACWGEPLKFVEKQRRIPDWSLMNFPPLLGKEPNENFQKQAIAMGISASCRYYGFGCGSGKSYIASSLIAHRMGKYHDCNKVLFVTTTIGVRNLYYELEKFIKGIDMSRVAIADKNNRLPFTEDVDIVICSYGTMRLIGNAYKEKNKIKVQSPKKPYLPIKEWCGEGGEAMLILDESHSASNHQAQQTQVLLVNAPLFKYRYLFSGTPADKPEKLWSQYEILDPYLNSNLSYSDWIEYYANIGNHFSKYAITGWKEDKLRELNERFTNGYGIFLETTDLLDLPENYERRVYIDLSSKHKKLYQDMVMSDLKGGSFRTKDIVNRFPYMQLALDCPELLKEHIDKFPEDTQKVIEGFKSTVDSEKVEAIDEILEEHHYGKCIIWCVHPKTIALLGERYEKHHPICIDGSIPQEDRFRLVEEFKKGDHALLIANILALNTSITVTEAKYQIYAERCYNYAQFEQSTRRIWRNGQKDHVETYYLIYTNSIDVLLDKNLESKGLLVEGLQSRDFLSKEDWKKIFNAEPNTDLKELESDRDMGNFGWFGQK